MNRHTNYDKFNVVTEWADKDGYNYFVGRIKNNDLDYGTKLEEELKQCPLCGSSRILALDTGNFDNIYLFCPDCGTRTADLSKRGAIYRWNHRPIEDSIRNNPTNASK